LLYPHQQKIERVAGQLGGAAAQEGQANANYMGALTGMIGGVTSMASSYMSAKGASAENKTNIDDTDSAGR